jgi:hypothetical protein
VAVCKAAAVTRKRPARCCSVSAPAPDHGMHPLRRVDRQVKDG